VRVIVTAKDIREGRRRSPCYCPVSRAIRRRTGILAQVYRDDVVYPGGYRVLLPMKALERISAYDAGGAMEPFRFDLSPYAYRTGLA
jgi:hypothetical protein